VVALMRPGVWQPPVVCSWLEQEVIKRVKRAKLFVWLREHRHELLDEALQAELAKMYADRPVGQPPVPPAQLALATILQAYTGVSDDEVVEATVMDRRWQLVLDCMDHAQAPFSKATLGVFRARLIEPGGSRGPMAAGSATRSSRTPTRPGPCRPPRPGGLRRPSP
jgi:transposase